MKPAEIIIPCLDNLQYTRRCYESLKRHTSIPFRLTFIDNASGAPSRKYLERISREESGVKLIRNSRNLGAPAAFNQGIASSDADLIILLNNDTVMTEGWASKLLKALKRCPAGGIAAPLLNPPPGKKMSLREINRLAVFIELKNRGSLREVPGVTSTCMAIRREVVEKIGNFDENYGPGTNDDHDFCLRAREAGFKIICSEEVFIYHYWNKTLGRMGLRELDRKNREYFISKFGDAALKFLSETGQLRDQTGDSCR